MGQKQEEMEEEAQAQISMQPEIESTPDQNQNMGRNLEPGKSFMLKASHDMKFTNDMIISENENADLGKEYEKLNCLGEGEESIIHRVKHNITEEIRAMKVIKKLRPPKQN